MFLGKLLEADDRGLGEKQFLKGRPKLTFRYSVSSPPSVSCSEALFLRSQVYHSGLDGAGKAKPFLEIKYTCGRQ